MKNEDGHYVTKTDQLIKKREKIGKTGLTQEQAAKKIGISNSHYNKIENNKIPPSKKARRKISQAYGVEEHELFTYKNNFIDMMKNENKEMILQYIENNPDKVNGIDHSGKSVLQVAASLRYCEETKLLIEKGADPLYQSPDGSTFLIIACKRGYTDIVETIFNTCKKEDIEKLLFELPDENGNTAFLWAAREGRRNVCKFLIEMVQKNWPEKEEDLIEDANDKSKTAIMRASGFNDIETIQLLLDHGADLTKKDYRGRRAENIAGDNGHDRIFEFLKEKRLEQEIDKPEKRKNLKDPKNPNNNNEFLNDIKPKLHRVKRQIEDIIKMMEPTI
jgi:ankyrin repeat protein